MGRFSPHMEYDPVVLEVPIQLARNYERVEEIVDDAVKDFIEGYDRNNFSIQIVYNVKREQRLDGSTTGYSGTATVALAYIRD